MALIEPGPLVSVVSGKIGGSVFFRTRGGASVRGHVVPLNPGSAFQSEVRANLANLSQRWSTVLTQDQRDSWEAYADAVPVPNRLGNPVKIGGMPMYVRCNTPRLQAIAAPDDIIDDAPVIFVGANYSLPSINAVAAGGDTVSIAFDNTDEWANEDVGAMFVYCSRPTNVTRNFFKGPYRFADVILGNGTTPPTSPASIDLPFNVESGQKIHVRVNVSRADARLGTDFRTNGVAI